MSNPFIAPLITDEDVGWAANLLGLQEGAFDGVRREVFRTVDSLDVAACPGSGKTTLLVGKLAVLSEKWRDRTRGICVLSHTNVARSEVETRLGNTSAGRRLLSYPHYIGTIHGFVNDFLALPWLRSQGLPVKRIDTALCQERRWAKLKFATRAALEKNGHDPGILSIKSPNVSLGTIRWGKNGTLASDTATYLDMQRVCRDSLNEGFHCYEEMFMWALDLIERSPNCIASIRDRFPLVFLDEAQDNSEDQSALLERVFSSGKGPSSRQRFGDSNQAIFDSINGSDAVTDRFPDDALKKDLPESHRFGQRIADLASPLGLAPQSLSGHGPQSKCVSEQERHTLFLFGDDGEKKVLSAYAELLCSTFSKDELRAGSFSAVGQVHRPPPTEDATKKPQYVGHYWPEYAHELTYRDPKPATMRDHVLLGISRMAATGEAHSGIDAIANGIARLLAIAETKTPLLGGRRSHRQVVRALEGHNASRRRYEYLLLRFVVRGSAPSKAFWEKVWRPVIKGIAEIVSGTKIETIEAEKFLAWKEGPVSSASPKAAIGIDNIFKFPLNDPKVRIRVGSIHSVKGETHTAILLLETFWYAHNLASLRTWLDGSRSGGATAGARDKVRLKLHYVGLTRPTHLLCLAMKQSSFWNDKGELDHLLLQRMKDRGWNVQLI